MSDRTNDGGPAFPVAEDHRVAADIPWTCGMSLRDWFAGMALSNSYTSDAPSPAHAAEWAYKVADEMLKFTKVNNV